MATTNVMVSMTFDGATWTNEVPICASLEGDYTHRFIGYGFGYVDNKFGYRLRWASANRLAFSLAKIRFG